MIIYLELLWTFFKVGLFTIGGGYAMIPMIQDEVVGRSWVSQAELIDFIGVSESTPGPFAINIATFVGWSQGGIFGAICSTLGVVLPSLIIIMLIAAVLKRVLKYRAVQGFFYGVRPVVVGLIASACVTIGVSVILPFVNLSAFSFDGSGFDLTCLILIAVFLAISQIKFTDRAGKKHTVNPILLVLLSAVCGLVLFGFIGL